jgi:hypothetical protein
MKITVANFDGLRPKLAAHLLEESQAQVAVNCRVEKADLRSWANSETQQTITNAAYESLYQYLEGSNSYWLYSINDCNFAESPIANDSFERLYLTGESEPRAYANDLVSEPFDQTTDYYKFGAAVPTAAPAFVSGHTGGSSYRAYVYTYVTRYGEETGPSPVLSTSTYNTGDVVLDTFTQPPAGYALRTKIDSNAPKIRVYRTNTSVTGAEFQYVGEFDIDAFNFSTGTFTDDVADADLGEVLPTEDYEGINASLSGLTGLSSGIMAGFVGNTLHLSEPYLPHAWPSEYTYSFDYSIVAIGHFGTNIVVLTEGFPYIVFGQSPDSMSKQRLPGFFPCTAKRGAVSTPFGVVYPSHEGMILLNHEGPRVLTEDYLTPDEWEAYTPTEIHGNFFNSKYFGFYNNDAGFILDIQNNLFVTLQDYRKATYRSVAGGKFYTIYTEPSTNETNIEEWEGDDYNYMYFTWKSKKFLLPQDTGFTCGQVIIDTDFYSGVEDAIIENQYLEGLNNTVWTSGDLQDTFNASTTDPDNDVPFNVKEFNASGLVDFSSISISNQIKFILIIDNEEVFEKNIMSDGLFRLPPIRGRRVEMQLSGYIPVRRVTIAQSPRELR